jgi:hypothetical protein
VGALFCRRASIDHPAARGQASLERRYGAAPTTAAGMVAGKGEATTISPGAPSTTRTDVATEEPPTPSRPMRESGFA